MNIIFPLMLDALWSWSPLFIFMTSNSIYSSLSSSLSLPPKTLLLSFKSNPSASKWIQSRIQIRKLPETQLFAY
jgi:hypothetical protein